MDNGVAQEVLEQAKREASLAGAPAPGATLPEQIAPNTAPSGHPAPANMHNIKLASAHEGALLSAGVWSPIIQGVPCKALIFAVLELHFCKSKEKLIRRAE